jgi:catechol 2,3-dioxygenase-like lactoylglutathione lyase family enzyme
VAPHHRGGGGHEAHWKSLIEIGSAQAGQCNGSSWARQSSSQEVFEMISGAHAIIYSRDAEADRAFLKDVLGLPFVDAGGGWLIFALPPAEVAVHPDESGGRHELYLLCTDIDTTLSELEGKGIRVERPPHDERWGRTATIRLPGGGELGIYEPKHPLASSAT